MTGRVHLSHGETARPGLSGRAAPLLHLARKTPAGGSIAAAWRSLALLGAALLVATPLAAAPALSCRGAAPDWSLTLGDASAVFIYLTTRTFEIPQFSVAEGGDWPRAYTLIADFDTAIVVIDRAACGPATNPAPFRAHVLTQRGETPILLTGCCEGAE